MRRGQCKALVCRVGDRSSRGDRGHEFSLDTTTDTKLQEKLQNLSDRFTLYGLGAALAIFAVLLITMFVEMFGAAEPEDEGRAPGLSAAGILFKKLPQHVNLIAVLVVVSIPEGLPLTIGISLAFSVMKMYGDKILVRKLDAPEKMGGAQEICCGKTGTITSNDMKVSMFYCESREIKNSRKDTLRHCELSEEARERIKESILYNCEGARVEMAATTYVPVGDGTEVALLRFLQDADVPVHRAVASKLDRIRAVSPFSPEKKRSAVALTLEDRPQRVAVYVKGAPEVVVNLCRLSLSPQGNDTLGTDERGKIEDAVTRLAGQSLRVIAFAFAEMDLQAWLDIENSHSSPGGALEDALCMEGMISFSFIGVIGLRDPLRPGVRESIRWARSDGELVVRLVSGDHPETAKAVALKAGILRPDEATLPYAVMHAEEFRARVG